MDITKQPMPQHGAHTGIDFAFEQIEQGRHRVSHSFPPWRYVARGTQIHGIVAVASKCRGWNQACGDTWLEQLAIPVLVSGAKQRPSIGAIDDFRDGRLHRLESLPIAARRECVAVLAIVIMVIRIPVTPLYSLDQSGGHAVPLDRQ